MPLPDSAGGAFFRKNRTLENSGKTRCRELQKFIRILLDFLHGNPENGKNCGRKRIAFRKKSLTPNQYSLLDELRSEINEAKAKIAAGEQPVFDTVDALFEALDGADE